MIAEQNKQLVRRLVEDAVNPGNLKVHFLLRSPSSGRLGNHRLSGTSLLPEPSLA